MLSAVGQRHLGFLRRADPNGVPGTIGIELDDTAEAYFKRLLAMPSPTDAWMASHRNQMLETSGEFPGLVQASDFPPFNGYIADVLPLAEDNYRVLVGMAGALVPQNTGRARALFRESVEIDRAVTNQIHRALRELRAAGRSGRGTRLAPPLTASDPLKTTQVQCLTR